MSCLFGVVQNLVTVSDGQSEEGLRDRQYTADPPQRYPRHFQVHPRTRTFPPPQNRLTHVALRAITGNQTAKDD